MAVSNGRYACINLLYICVRVWTILFWLAEGASSPTVLRFGHVVDVSSTSDAVKDLRKGIERAFAEYNEGSGRQCNRSLVLTTATVSETNATRVVAQLVSVYPDLIGFTGSYGPSSVSVTSTSAQQNNVPLIAPISGSVGLRSSSSNATQGKNVFHLRASQADEGLALVQYLRYNRSFELIAVFYEPGFLDSVGTIDGLTKACSATGYGLLTSTGCTAGSCTQSSELNRTMNALIMGSSPHIPEAIIIIATASVTTAFVSHTQQVYQTWGKSIFFGIISDGDPPFFHGKLGDRIAVSQVVPSLDATSSVFLSEGYLSGSLLTSVFKKSCVERIDAAFLLSALSDSLFRVGNLSAGPFSATCNQGLRSVWLSTTSDPRPSSEPAFVFPQTVCNGIEDLANLGIKAFVFGQVADFASSSMPSSATMTMSRNGRLLREGILAAFEKQNHLGGISGHRLRLISVDAGSNAVSITRQIITRGVFGLIGNVGPSASAAVASAADETGVPLISPFSGARAFRENRSSVINVRASCQDEINSLVSFAVSKLNMTSFAFFYQKDSFGRQGLSFLQTALQAVNLQILSNGSCAAGSSDVESGLTSIVTTAAPFVPEAVVIWANEPSVSAFLRMARTLLPASTVFLCSSMIAGGLSASLGESFPENLFISQVFPLFSNDDFPIVRQYHSAMSAGDPTFQPSMVSLEGYINARFLILALDRTDQDGRHLIESVQTFSSYRFGGLSLGHYSDSCNQGMRSIWMSQLTTSGFVPIPDGLFTWSDDMCLSGAGSISGRILLFGQSSDFSGPLAKYGPALLSGIQAAFAERNAKGGIAGYGLRVISLDDGYMASRAVANTQSFLSRSVYGLIGYCGTAVSTAVAALAKEVKIPFFGPYSGTTTVRHNNSYVINIRASYADEVNALVDFAVSKLDIIRISLFYQNDSFGQQGIAYLQAALRAVNLEILSFGSFAVNTVDVERGFANLMADAFPFVPEAIFVWGPEAPVSAFIQFAQNHLPTSTVYLCASVAGEGLASSFGNHPPSHLYMSQVFPLVNDYSYPIIQDYHTAMRAMDPSYQPSMISLESFISARFLIDCLVRITPERIGDREFLLDVIYSSSFFGLSGLLVGPYTETCNQGMRKVWLSRIADGLYLPLPDDTFTFAECMSDARSFQDGFLLFGRSGASTAILESIVSLSDAGEMGILTAFDEINRNGGVGQFKLKLVTLEDGYVPSRGLENAQFLIQRNVYALIGFVGTATSALVAPLAAAKGIPYVTPSTGATSMRNASLTTINIRASYADEINAMVHYLVSFYGYLHISIFYQGDGFGLDGKVSLTKALDAIGVKILSSGNYSVSSGDVERGLEDILQGAKPNVPDVVFIWAVGSAAAAFITAASDRLPAKTLYFCSSFSGDANFISAIPKTTSTAYVAQILPSLQQTSDALVQHYLEAQRQYDPSATPSVFALETYIAARLFATVLSRMRPEDIKVPGKFMEEFYSNALFPMDSITLGPFSRDCNQGLRRVWISKYMNDQFVEVPGYSFDFSGSCLSDPFQSLRRPILFGYVMEKDSISGFDILQGLLAIRNEVNLNGGVSGHAIHFFIFEVDPFRDNRANLTAFVSHDEFSAIISAVDDPATFSILCAITEARNLLLIGHTRLISWKTMLPIHSSRIYIAGSPLDEAYAVTRFMKKHLKINVVAAFYELGRNGEEVARSIQAALEEFGLDSKGIVGFNHPALPEEMAGFAISDRSIQAVIISGKNVVKLVAYLKSTRPELLIFLISSDFDLNALRGGPNDGIFLTHFLPPIGTHTNEFSGHCQDVFETLNASNFNPGLMTSDGCLIGGFLVEIIKFAGLNGMSPLHPLDPLYVSQMFSVNGYRLGPYTNSSCQMRSNKVDCECDQGLHTVYLLHLMNNTATAGLLFFDMAGEGTFTFDSCGVQLTPISSSAGISIVIISIIIAFVAVVVLVGIGLVRMVLSKRRQRAAALAKAPKGNVAIVFTDVQDSTNLWDTCTKMKEALELHNNILRSLIDKNGGYEVKTQGDSFMVAFGSSDSAVAWALDVQEQLLNANWPDNLLEQESCIPVKRPDLTEHPESSELPAFLFRGLRVRVGIHCGYPEYEYNPRTNGVDYFGPIVNGAARIEALGAGGQILISSEAYTQMSPQAVKNLVFTCLGRFPLKGMVTEQEVIQVSSQRLAARQFPVIDPRRIVIANNKGQPMCPKCDRPLQCSRCATSASAATSLYYHHHLLTTSSSTTSTASGKRTSPTGGGAVTGTASRGPAAHLTYKGSPIFAPVIMQRRTSTHNAMLSQHLSLDGSSSGCWSDYMQPGGIPL